MFWDHDDDKPREECGVIGVYGHPEASLLTALGLHALQHRGQEACGIATFDGEKFHNERHMGLVGENFGEDDLYTIGRAFGSEMADRGLKSACVGYDGRLSSPMLEAALVDGLTECGIDVIRTGRGPSPMLYYATVSFEADAGLMITGSHNPPDFNGLKMTLEGKAFFDEDIQNLGRRVQARDGAGSLWR